jgi:hypothetical protein
MKTNTRNKSVAVIVSKPFQALFQGAEIHLKEAETIWKDEEVWSEARGSQDLDYRARLMRAHCRACIVMSVAGAEAFTEWIYANYRLREPQSLPNKKWVPRECADSKSNTLRDFSTWRLHHKVWVLPSLCRETPVSPTGEYDRAGRIYNDFIEFTRIRNYIVHGTESETVLDIGGKKGRLQLVSESRDKNNFWPRTKIPKDLFSIGAGDARAAFENVLSVSRKLYESCEGRITKDDLQTQTVKTQLQVLKVERETTTTIPNRQLWAEEILGSKKRSSPKA